MLYNNFLRHTFFLVLFALLFSCQKSETSSTDSQNTENDADQYGIPYKDIPYTADIVIYEIKERAFNLSGDFDGKLPRLDSIMDLGLNVI